MGLGVGKGAVHGDAADVGRKGGTVGGGPESLWEGIPAVWEGAGGGDLLGWQGAPFSLCWPPWGARCLCLGFALKHPVGGGSRAPGGRESRGVSVTVVFLAQSSARRAGSKRSVFLVTEFLTGAFFLRGPRSGPSHLCWWVRRLPSWLAEGSEEAPRPPRRRRAGRASASSPGALPRDAGSKAEMWRNLFSPLL